MNKININIKEKCPHCGNTIGTSLCVNILNSQSYEKKDGMGYDTQMRIESEPLSCKYCDKNIILRGLVGEYPIGTIEYTDVKFEKF